MPFYCDSLWLLCDSPLTELIRQLRLRIKFKEQNLIAYFLVYVFAYRIFYAFILWISIFKFSSVLFHERNSANPREWHLNHPSVAYWKARNVYFSGWNWSFYEMSKCQLSSDLWQVTKQNIDYQVGKLIVSTVKSYRELIENHLLNSLKYAYYIWTKGDATAILPK